MELGYPGAFLGGILTLLSPCSVMLLPAFFSYAFTSRGTLIARTGVFYLGLITTLVPLGVLAGSLGALLTEHRDTIITVASAVVIALGAIQLLGIPVPGLAARRSGASATTAVSVYLLGTVYGVAGVCTGPLLGAVLTLAALQGTALAGGVMLLIYAAGMVVPLLVLALVWDISDRTRRLARPRRLSLGRWSNSWTNIIGGILTVVLGIFLLLTHAATSLTGGVGVNQTFALEGWIVDNKVGGVANLAIAAAALALLAALFTIRHRRRRRAERPSRDCDRTRQSTS